MVSPLKNRKAMEARENEVVMMMVEYI